MDKHTVQRYKNNNIILCAIKTSRNRDRLASAVAYFDLAQYYAPIKTLHYGAKKYSFIIRGAMVVRFTKTKIAST